MQFSDNGKLVHTLEGDIYQVVNLYSCTREDCEIIKRLKYYHQLDISIDTVRRMYEDVLKLKSLKIDEKTKEIVQEQGFILLGLEGQDPGGDSPSIWCFMDLMSNQILATSYFFSSSSSFF